MPLTGVNPELEVHGSIDLLGEDFSLSRKKNMNSANKVSRRFVLRGAVAAAGAVPVLLSGVGAAYAKVPKQSVSYRETPNGGNSCSICANFVAPSSCLLVEGAINTDGWCGLFKTKG